MGTHEKNVPKRSDLSPGKCAPSLEYGKRLTADAVDWVLGPAVKIMDAGVASRSFIITDIVIEMDVPIFLGDEEID
jgi:hypothetical protein